MSERRKRIIGLACGMVIFVAACFAPPPQIVAVSLGFLGGLVMGAALLLFEKPKSFLNAEQVALAIAANKLL